MASILELWVPTLVFAHVFAFIWLSKFVVLTCPWAATQLQRLATYLLGSLGRQSSSLPDSTETRGYTDPKNRIDVLSGSICEATSSAPAPAPAPAPGQCLGPLTFSIPQTRLSWQGLSCSYPTRSGHKVVLQGARGQARGGEMVALMGPSGSGKSTLLDILSCRKTSGHITGSVLLNGQPVEPRTMRTMVYVPQDVVLIPSMTVEETLTMYAWLALPTATTDVEKRLAIDNVLRAMGLQDQRGTLVGGPLPGGICLSGLSGGESKRLSIAIEVICSPPVIFLDEPTSGLDSYAALHVMGLLRHTAQGGSLVIVVVHQPRLALWNMFDQVCILSSGHLLYYGPRAGVLPWFCGSLGYIYQPHEHGAVSDWVIDLVNVGFAKVKTSPYGTIATIKDLQAVAQRFMAEALEAIVDMEEGTLEDTRGTLDVEVMDDVPNAVKGVHEEVMGCPPTQVQGHHVLHSTQISMPRKISHTRASWTVQYRVLVRRHYLEVTRNPADVAGRMLIFTYVAMFTGLVWYAHDPNPVSSMRATLGLLFASLFHLMLQPYIHMAVYTSAKRYCLFDLAAEKYWPSAYYLAKQTVIVPFNVINSTTYMLVIYGLVGLRRSSMAVLTNTTCGVLLYLIASEVLDFSSMVMPNQDLAFVLAVAWTAVQVFWSGFFVRFSDMSLQGLGYLRYLSALSFAWGGAVHAEYHQQHYNCSRGLPPNLMPILPQLLPNTSHLFLPSVRAALTSPGPGCGIEGNAILRYYQQTDGPMKAILKLVAYYCAIHLLSWAGFKWACRKEER